MDFSPAQLNYLFSLINDLLDEIDDQISQSKGKKDLQTIYDVAGLRALSQGARLLLSKIADPEDERSLHNPERWRRYPVK